MDEIDLQKFLKANESEIRWAVESLILDQVTRAIGHENLGKVSLTLQGSTFDDLAIHVEGPDDLRSKIEEALLKPKRRRCRGADSSQASGTARGPGSVAGRNLSRWSCN